MTNPASTRISVIMPCYNAASYVREAVECVMSQSYRDVELIVVDDGSSDGSTDILRELATLYAPRICLLSQDRKGPYPARNLALSHANGARVAFLDADDYLALDCLQELSDALDRAHADIAYCGWQNVGDGAPGGEPYIPPDYCAIDTAAEFLRSCPWPIHAALINREAIHAVGGFSERRFSSMDYDLWLRLFAHTQKIVRVPKVLAFYRWHGSGQISKTKWKQVLDALQVRRDFIREYPERISHLSPDRVDDLCDGFLLREAYRAYWQRNLEDAQKLFRHALRQGVWKARDLRYLLPALLPSLIFQGCIRAADRLNR